MATTAAERHTSLLLKECPVLDGRATAQYKAAARAARDFTVATGAFLGGMTPKERATWLKVTVQSGRTVFQPWSMELLYVLATEERARFGVLLELLGLSSRTLSDKLKALREAGLVERQVFDEQPVRIEYFLTKHGQATAAMAAPLFAHLNLAALKEAGRL